MCVQLTVMFSHHNNIYIYIYTCFNIYIYILKHVSALSGHRQVIYLYIHVFTLLLFLPTLANVVLHIGEAVY
jgi:hypothetical protein